MLADPVAIQAIFNGQPDLARYLMRFEYGRPGEPRVADYTAKDPFFKDAETELSKPSKPGPAPDESAQSYCVLWLKKADAKDKTTVAIHEHLVGESGGAYGACQISRDVYEVEADSRSRSCLLMPGLPMMVTATTRRGSRSYLLRLCRQTPTT